VITLSLEDLWPQYEEYTYLNRDCLPSGLLEKGIQIEYKAGSTIISAGDYPEYGYFIKSGTVQGVRQYADGNNYYYFTLNEKDGSVGLLELFSRDTESIATIIAKTDVVATRIPSDEIYKYIMNDVELLRRCLHTTASSFYLRSGNDGLLYYKRGLDRVKYFLIQYYENNNTQNSTIILKSDFQSIAHSIGISSRTVGRSMKVLKEEGFVNFHKKKFSMTYEQYKQLLAESQI